MQSERSEHAQRYLDLARSLAPEILAARAEMDHKRCLPQALVRSLRDSEMFHLWLPRSIGGPQLHPADFLAVIEELSRADGSVGWCAANAGVMSMLCGSLTEPVARAVSNDGTVGCGSLTPGGKAVPVAGGYRVSGRWNYASGIGHSGWVVGNSMILEEGTQHLSESKTLGLRFLFFPIEQVRVIDAWDVIGMRGTGSHDFEVDDLFVPEDFSMPTFVNRPLHPGTLYRIPRLSLFSVAIASVTLGIARAAVEALAELARDKRPLGALAPLREKASAQTAIGRAEALLRAARAGLVAAIDRQWKEIDGGTPPSLDSRGGLRLATTFAAEASARVVDIVHEAAGGSALLESGRIGRCFRDIHTATQHIGLHTNNYEICGRVLLGMDPGTPRF